jgi:hypothetical protein
MLASSNVALRMNLRSGSLVAKRLMKVWRCSGERSSPVAADRRLHLDQQFRDLLGGGDGGVEIDLARARLMVTTLSELPASMISAEW